MFTPERERRESQCAVYVTHFGPFWDRMVGWGVKGLGRAVLMVPSRCSRLLLSHYPTGGHRFLWGVW